MTGGVSPSVGAQQIIECSLFKTFSLSNKKKSVLRLHLFRLPTLNIFLSKN